MNRLWHVLGSSALVISLWALPASAADPAPDWTLIDTQTVRYFLPDPSPPPPDARKGDSAGMDPAGDPQWNLVATERVKYFVADDGQVEEQVVDRGAESRVVSAGRTRERDTARDPKRGAVYEASRANWSRESIAAAPQGRYLVTTGTYKVARYRDVEYPYTDIDHFKRQTRSVSRVGITVRSRILTSSGGEVIPGDAGATRVETREGPWTDQGGTDPALDKVVAHGYESPVQEFVDYTTRKVEEARQPLVSDGQTSASAVSTGTPVGFSTGASRGSESQGGADAGATRRLAGSAGVQARGGQAYASPFAGLGSVFWGRSGNKTLFRFNLSEQRGVKLLSIFPLDAGGKVAEASGATWALDAQGTMPTQAVSTTGLAVSMTDAVRTGNGARVRGSFKNKLTGDTAGSLDLGSK